MTCKSAFSGYIKEIPGVFFDNFKNRNGRAYFLSHYHGDHIQGLDSLYFRNLNVYMYMSEVTAIIVKEYHPEIAKFVIPLKLGTTVINLSKIGTEEELHITVTLIPAGHTIGSVMFLMKVDKKTILYTGDFRYSTSDVSKIAALHNKHGDVIDIDIIYADTTFNNISHKHFPKRSDSVKVAIEEIRQWLTADKDNKVVLCTSARNGYEFVFNEIYKELNIKILVDEKKWNLYRQLLDEVPSVDIYINSRISLCPKFKHNHCHGEQNTLHILFSAWRWENYDMENNPIEDDYRMKNRKNICFSTHCSDIELKYFIEYLSPKKAIGFLNGVENNILTKSSTISNSNIINKRKKLTSSPIKQEINEDKKVPPELLKKMFAGKKP